MAAFDAYADALFRHALYRVRDRAAAEDLTQETFCRAWTYLARGGEPVRNIRAFLYRILGNLIIDRARKAREQSLDALMDEGFQVSAEVAPPADVSADARTAVELLAELEEPYRAAVAMRYLDGLPPKEIAEALGVSATVVSVRVFRGIAKLRKLMETRKR
jgi:RNA polymerase sigma-70 factor (ECF subfamily)